MQWYLTRYARLSNGELELITYTEMSLTEAQHKARTKLPNNEFYEVEHRVGSLLPALKFCLETRDRYSHKQTAAKLQAEAEVKAQQLLAEINQDSLSLDLPTILTEMQVLKPALTKPQYEVLLNSLMSKPCVIKILYEKEIH